MQVLILQTAGGFASTGETGGGVLYILGLAEEWASTGHQVNFVTNSQDQCVYSQHPTLSVYRSPAYAAPLDSSPLNFFLGAMFSHPIQWRFLKSLVSAKLLKPAIILASSPYPSDVFAALRLRKTFGLPAAVYFHHLNPPPWWHPMRRGHVIRAAMNWLLTLFALSLSKLGGLTPVLSQPDQLDRTGWKFQRWMASQYFLDVGQDSGPRQPVCEACFVGRVAPNKGVIDLLRVWKIVTETVPKAKLVIAGKRYSRRFEKLLGSYLRQLGLLKSVEYRGYLSTEEKRKLLNQSRLFVYPSYEEGWSLGVMEAAYYGVVPIIYDLPAYEYLDCTDIKVPVGDIHSMAQLIVSLLKDKSRASLIARRLKATVSGYTRQTIARNQIAQFELLLQEHAQAHSRNS